MKKLIILLSLFLLIIPPSQASERVIRVIDGDTLIVTRYGKVRFFGIDTPESRQFFGKEATAHLIQLIGNERVNCISLGYKTYGRKVCILVTESGINLNRAMVQDGYAYNEPRYSKGLFLNVEKEARENKRGLWAYPNLEKPWIWRRK